MQKPQGRSSDGELLKSELDVDRKVANLFIIGRTWKESIASEGSHDIIPLWGVCVWVGRGSWEGGREGNIL